MDSITRQQRNKIVGTFEDFVNKNSGKDYWKSIDEIASISGTTANDVTKIIHSFDEFVKNKEDEYTTRRLYRKYTPFYKKFINAYSGKID